MSRQQMQVMRRIGMLFGCQLMAACGGEDSSAGAVAAPPVVSPTPTPAPLPSPPTPPRSTSGMIANVGPGGVLVGNLACARGDYVYAPTPDGGLRLADARRIDALDPARSGIAIRYRATDSFETDINGLGGPVFAAQSRKNENAGSPWTGTVYFRNPPVGQYADEFEIDTGNGAFGSAFHATFGRLSDGQALCFFAAGSDRGPIPTQGARDFYVVGDGLALIGGAARRIAMTEGLFRVDWAARTIDLTLVLRTGAPAFAMQAGWDPIGQANARLTLTQGGGISGVMTGPGGAQGQVAGRFFELGNGAGLVFDLSWPNGDRAFAALAVETL